MKFLLSIALLFSLSIDVAKLRSLYDQAVLEEDKADELIALTEAHVSESPLYLGYYGATRILLAKHAFSPVSKLNHFNRGKKDLEKAIAKDPENIELRYLRLTIQENVPGVLNYSGEIQTDRSFLLARLNGIADKDLQTRIRNFINRKK